MTETAPEPTQTYNGNCHCGYFRFTITTPPITSTAECNCSICFRKGYKWVFPPAGGIEITHPVDNPSTDALKKYTFDKKTTEHVFCPTCGTGVMAVRPAAPPGMNIAVNARTLQGLAVLDLPANPYDGRALEPAWVPKAIDPLPSSTENQYTGSCHCGNAKLAFSTAVPIDSDNNKQRTTLCDCSICVRNATILTFPEPTKLTQTIDTPLTQYRFGKGNLVHEFCPICGCQVRASWDGEAKGKMAMPVNLRMFEAVDFEKLTVKRLSFKDAEPAYELK